ncbi:hypothetical protein [Nocardia sienata]|nr:hypothetical protein [Nocardia sienata]
MNLAVVQPVSLYRRRGSWDDELWVVIEPLLPVRAPGTPGPARMDDRLVL